MHHFSIPPTSITDFQAFREKKIVQIYIKLLEKDNFF